MNDMPQTRVLGVDAEAQLPKVSRMSVRKSMNLVPWVVAAAGVAVTYLAYAPGLVPHDALNQLHQAETGRFDDVFPPIMAWLWSKTIAIIPGPEGFFLLLIGLYWAGFFLLIRYLLHLNLARVVIASALPFSPILFNFAGTIWKDMFVSGCFLVATAIILMRPYSSRAVRFPIAPSLVVLILLLLGSLARWNSVPAVVPLFVLAIWPEPSAIAPLRRTFYRLAVCAPIVLLVWFATGKLLDVTVFHAEKTGFANLLPAWDLVNMSHHVGKNLLPGPWSEKEPEKIVESCYDPISANTIGFYNPDCYFIIENLKQNGYWHETVLFPLLANALLSHPRAYLDTRLNYVHTLFWPNSIFMFDADNEANAFNHHPGLLFQIEKQVLSFCRTAPILQFVFTLAFWMIAAALLTIAFAIAVMRGRSGCYSSMLLSLSAGLSLWPLVIIGPDGQLRYAYWSIVAICIALLIARRDTARADEISAEPVVPPRLSTAGSA